MNPQILSRNIRRIRTARKYSQQTLAEAAGLSLPAVKNLEGAKNEPRMSTVQAIARALEVRLQDLFAPVRELRTVRFRSGRKMQNRENILAEVARWLDDFNYLERILNEQKPFLLREAGKKCSRKDPVKAARLCREALGLNECEPIYDICGLLEHAGIKVLPISMASDGFFGLSLGAEDGGPAVVVNVSDRISVERHIFSAAHELGHLMLHPDAYDVNESEENHAEEEEANRFAGHFLMPDEGFRKEWAEAAGLRGVDRVLKVKCVFRVSYKTVLARLVEHRIADDTIWKKFNLAFRKRFNRRLSFKEEPLTIEYAEPFGTPRFDFTEDRFRRLARRAVEEDLISVSRGAEILRIGVDEMQELIASWEAVV